MQPDIHFRRAIERAGVVQFFRELLTRRKAAVEIENLHEVYDRLPPVELLALLGREIAKDAFDIHLLPR